MVIFSMPFLRRNTKKIPAITYAKQTSDGKLYI